MKEDTLYVRHHRMPGRIQDVRDRGARRRRSRGHISLELQEFGRLDVLVNNAAFQSSHDSIEEFSTEELQRTFRTNLYATFWLSRAALPRMEAGIAIINTASIQAFDPSPNPSSMRQPRPQSSTSRRRCPASP
jgi:NAD(P)-dependent dehydrogenase (short-subunit alcohol dehydrogenase family)